MVACLAHVRRKFVDVHKAQGSDAAFEAIRRIADLYAVEKVALGLPPDKRTAIRHAEARPVFDGLEAWLSAQLPNISGISPMASATRYALTRMARMRPYLDHGILEIDTDLLPAQARRATPYLYSPQEIAALMHATTILRGSHVQATYRTLIGLLAATGMRTGEAISLDRDDFDAGSGMVTIRHGKFDKARALPLHPSTVAALDDYLCRDDRPRSSGMPPLLISSRSKRMRYSTVQPIFHKLLHRCGIAPRSAACRPRIHDLRHSFAVSTIVDDYRSGNPGSRLAILSTYLGHEGPGATYWYLSAAPELLGLAGERLERHLAGDA